MTEVTGMSALRKRIFEIIEVGKEGDYTSRAYDFLNMLTIVVNLTISVLYTFEEIRAAHSALLLTIEAVTVAFFAFDFLLRVFTAKQRYPKLSEGRALVKYIFSLTGMSDLQKIPRDEVRTVLEKHACDGILHVPKEYGMFIAIK